MSLRLPEDPINPQDMFQNFVEQHQRDIQLLLVEYLENIPKLHQFPKHPQSSCVSALQKKINKLPDYLGGIR